MTPRFFIIFNSVEQMQTIDFGSWIDPHRGAHFNNNIVVIDGEKFEDRTPWCILSRQREKERLCDTGAKTVSELRLKRSEITNGTQG